MTYRDGDAHVVLAREDDGRGWFIASAWATKWLADAEAQRWREQEGSEARVESWLLRTAAVFRARVGEGEGR